jgi:hypothetical protein
MATYVVLTRLTPESAKTPADLKRLERVMTEHIRRECPQAKWVANYVHPWTSWRHRTRSSPRRW